MLESIPSGIHPIPNASRTDGWTVGTAVKGSGNAASHTSLTESSSYDFFRVYFGYDIPMGMFLPRVSASKIVANRHKNVFILIYCSDSRWETTTSYYTEDLPKNPLNRLRPIVLFSVSAADVTSFRAAPSLSDRPYTNVYGIYLNCYEHAKNFVRFQEEQAKKNL